jgi:cell division protein FtsB
MFRDYLRHLIIILVFVGAAWWLKPAYGEYLRTRDTLQEMERKRLDSSAQNDDLRQQIHRLRHDSRAIERVAREKFGYCRQRETIYDFSEVAVATPVD